MWKSIAVAGGIGAAIIGVGTVAMAESGSSSTPAPTPTTSTPSTAGTPSTTAKGHGHGGLIALKRFEHGEWVSKDKSGVVTHDAIKGSVTAVSPTSIVVTAEDGTVQTYTVTATTKVAERENGKGSGKKGVIGDVKKGDHVLVSGTKSGTTLTAVHVLDAGTK